MISRVLGGIRRFSGYGRLGSARFAAVLSCIDGSFGGPRPMKRRQSTWKGGGPATAGAMYLGIGDSALPVTLVVVGWYAHNVNHLQTCLLQAIIREGTKLE
jgi:hypothetical protein